MNEASLLAFSLSITGPIFMVVLLGLLLKRLGVIQTQFVQPASDLVFKVGLPAILFLSIYRADLDNFSMGLPLLVAIPITLMMFALSLPLARLFIVDKGDCGVFVQGAFRGNLAVIGLAFCSNAYGEAGLAAAAVPVAVLTILYNLLAVVALNPIESGDHQSPLRRIVMNTLKNPLLIGIALGFMMKFSGLPLPKLIEDTGNYFARMTLPLALLCIGASMNMKALKHSGVSTVAASILKLIVAPLLMVSMAIWLGVRGMELGILFFLVASPTAVASFIQVRAMGGNGEFAANIVVMSTLLGIVTVTAGLLVLKAFSLI
jgi:predicted permease|tara:strand:+ start:15278 stop:16231 length:954 start_codon:yes stop_codon:yes gene_type:complete